MNFTKIAVALVAACQAVNITANSNSLVQHSETDINVYSQDLDLSSMPALEEMVEEEEAEWFFTIATIASYFLLNSEAPVDFPEHLGLSQFNQAKMLRKFHDKFDSSAFDSLKDKIPEIADSKTDLKEWF